MKDFENINLVIIDGSIINIQHPTDIDDTFFDEMNEAIENGTCWFIANYTEATATFKGKYLEFINTKQIVGW